MRLTRQRHNIAEEQRGGVAVIAAISGALACLMAAVVVDGGSVALHARRIQAAADLAALAATRDLPRAPAAAQATALANLSGVQVATVVGIYRADASLTPAQRFQATTTPDVSPNAARVTVTGSAPVWFTGWALGRDTVTVTRTGTAARAREDPMAMLSIGSRLARLDGGIANAVLGGLTGSTISLTAMDYRALADADVELLAFADALATRAGVTVADEQGFMDADVDAGDALAALETVSDGADVALTRLASAANGQTLNIGKLIGLEAGAREALEGAINARVSALDLAGAIVEVAGKNRQLALDLGAQGGLADLDVTLAIGERPNRSPWLSVSKTGGITVRTAQARLYLAARTADGLASLGQITLPVLVELASSEARLEAIACAPTRSVGVGVRPGLARAWVGAVDLDHLDDFKSAPSVGPAKLVSAAGLVSVNAYADAEVASPDFATTTFTEDDIRARRIRTTGSSGLGTSLVSSLLGRLEVDVKMIGLGLGLGNLTKAVGSLLSPVGQTLDPLLDTLLAVLGLSVGEADVIVHDLLCPDRPGAPYLVS